MAPSEGDRLNHFAQYGSTPEGQKDLQSSDESDSVKTDKVINKDTISDVINNTPTAPPPSVPTNTPKKSTIADQTSDIQPVITQKNRLQKSMHRKSPPRQQLSKEYVHSYKPSNWGSDSSDEIGDLKPAARKTNKEAINNITTTEANMTIRMNTSPLQLEDTTVHHYNSPQDSWDGTVVRGKKTPTKSNVSTRRQEIASPSEFPETTGTTSPPINKSPSNGICGAYGSLRDVREGAVKYERIIRNGNSFNPVIEATQLFQAIQVSDPKAFFSSMKDHSLQITDPNQVPNSAESLEAFFESSMTKSTDNTKYIMSFRIRTSMSLQVLKEVNNRSLLQHLKQTHATLSDHRFASLITEKIGWFSMKSIHVSLEGFREALGYEFSEPTTIDTSQSNTEPRIPPFEVVTARVAEAGDTSGKSELVLAISCQEADGDTLRKLFSQQALDSDRYGAFVLFSTKRSNPEMHDSMVSRHRKFTRATWSLQVTGLEWGLLYSVITDPQDNTSKQLIDAILHKDNGIVAIDDSKITSEFPLLCFTIIRESKKQAKNFICNELPVLAALSVEFNGQAIRVDESGRSATSLNAEKLAEKFPNIQSTPQRSYQKRISREHSTIPWPNNLQNFPLLPQAEPSSPPQMRSYRHAAAKPIPKHNPLTSLEFAAGKMSQGNKNTRTFQTLTTLAPKAKSASATSIPTSLIDLKTSLNTSVEIDMGNITMADTNAEDWETTSPSIAASIQSVLTEFSRKLQKSEEVNKLQEAFVRDAATALKAQKLQVEELKRIADERANNAAQSIEAHNSTVTSSLETLMAQVSHRDKELAETKAHLAATQKELTNTNDKLMDLHTTMSQKIDTQRYEIQHTQDRILERFMASEQDSKTSQQAQTAAIINAFQQDFRTMQTTIEMLKSERESTTPSVESAPTTPNPQNPVSSVNLHSITSLSTLTCPTSGRTTSLPETQVLVAICEDKPQHLVLPRNTSEAKSFDSSQPLAALGKRHTVATPTVPKSSTTPSPPIPTKRHKLHLLETPVPTLITSPTPTPNRPSSLAVTPNTLFDSAESKLATTAYNKELGQAQLNDPKLCINHPDLASFLLHEQCEEEQRENDAIALRVESDACESPDSQLNKVSSALPLATPAQPDIDTISAATNPTTTGKPRLGRPTKSPFALATLSKTLFSTSSCSSNATKTTASSSMNTESTTTGQEAIASNSACESPRMQE